MENNVFSTKFHRALKQEIFITHIAFVNPEFKEIRPSKIKEKGIKVVIDGKNCLDKQGIKALGIVYKGIGR
ncbi:hypothetical protein FP803_01255 [Candidatus Woesearchaeota archaeon]|nr:hypothetical protein [Candidatus Woesearchaeota archaeon]